MKLDMEDTYMYTPCFLYCAVALLLYRNHVQADPDASNSDTNTNVIHGFIYRDDYPTELSGLSNDRPNVDVLPYDNTHQSVVLRLKRAFSPFAHAWNAILKNALGFQRRGVAGANGKVYVKIGAFDDALRDFNSLHPSNVQFEGHAATGRIDNYDILVFNNAGHDDLRSSTLYVVDFSKGTRNRAVIYFKNMADAEAYIHKSQ